MVRLRRRSTPLPAPHTSSTRRSLASSTNRRTGPPPSSPATAPGSTRWPLRCSTTRRSSVPTSSASWQPPATGPRRAATSLARRRTGMPRRRSVDGDPGWPCASRDQTSTRKRQDTPSGPSNTSSSDWEIALGTDPPGTTRSNGARRSTTSRPPSTPSPISAATGTPTAVSRAKSPRPAGGATASPSAPPAPRLGAARKVDRTTLNL